jgi:endoglucanase
MVAAHMDEIGLMVSHIDRKGYLRFTNLGGLFPLTLAGNRVKFEDGTVGNIQLENYWDFPSKTPKLNDFYVDASIATTDDGKNDIAERRVGDVACLWRTMEERGDRIIAKSMDDRIGCVVGIEAMRKLKDRAIAHEVYFVFTVQEEVGTRGAQASAYGIEPDLGIALDVTVAAEIKDGWSDVELGKGTAIKMMDTGLIVAPKVRQLMIDTAEKHEIPYQREVLRGGSTDARAIHLTRAGVPSGCISIPTRYVHSVSETVDIHDVQASIDLLTAILSNPVEW